MRPASIQQVSNRSDWRFFIELKADDGELINLDLVGIEFRMDSHENSSWGLGDYGNRRLGYPALALNIGNGISVVGVGVAEILVRAAQMKSIAPGYYDCGCIITAGLDTEQLFIGTVTIVDGVVRP